MKMKILVVFVLVILLLFFQVIVEDWYFFVYGVNDEIGVVNLLIVDVVKCVVLLVRIGKIYLLVVLVDKNLFVFCYCSFCLYNVQVGQQVGRLLGFNRFIFNDELVNVWIGVGIQFNGIGYIGIDNVYYNGNKVVDFVIVDGVCKFGVEKVLLMVIRGVVLDMIVYYGKVIVFGGIEFIVVDIQVVLKKQGLSLCKGDVVLFNIGWLELIGKDNM